MRLVLGPGLAPGFIGLGVLSAIEEAGLLIDEVIGVNTGAVVATLWATQIDLRMTAQVLAHLPWCEFMRPSDDGEDRLLAALDVLTQRKRFDQITKNVAVIVRDGLGGFCRIIKTGPLALAARGSMNVPGLFATKPSHDAPWYDPGADWSGAVIKALLKAKEKQGEEVVWVIPPGSKQLAHRGNSADSTQQWAAYVATNWAVQPPINGVHLSTDAIVGDLLSFDRIPQWVEAGKAATMRWLAARGALAP